MLEDVTRLLAAYNLVASPVVMSTQHLIGATVDDAPSTTSSRTGWREGALYAWRLITAGSEDFPIEPAARSSDALPTTRSHVWPALGKRIALFIGPGASSST